MVKALIKKQNSPIDGLKVMLEHKPSLEGRDIKGNTPLILAIESNMESAVDMLVS